MKLHDRPVSASAPVMAKRQANSSRSGQSTAAIMVRLVILRFDINSAAISSPPISRGSGVMNSSSRSAIATSPLIAWARSKGWRGTSATSRVTASTVPSMRSCHNTQITA